MKKILPAALLILLYACSTEPAPPPPLTIDYSSFGTINLAVANITITDRSVPMIAQSMPLGSVRPAIADAVHRWADDRLRAVGASGEAIFIIKDARITVEPLSVVHGPEGWFTRQQASKYTAHITVDMEAHGVAGYAIASAKAQREVSLPEDPSAAERQQAYNDLLAGLMQDLNRNLDQNIHEHMQNFVVTAPILPNSAPPPAAPSKP